MKDCCFIESYTYEGGIGALVELSFANPETPTSPAFVAFAKNLARHIAAMEPTSPEDLLSQPSVMNPEKAVGHLMIELADDLHDKLAVNRFVRWVAGGP